MTHQATINDEHVTYRPGDGAPIEIPQGPVEVELAPDSATLSWTEENGAAGLTAIPLTEFIDHVEQNRITVESADAAA
ncbi:MAG: hypothetical protein V4627_02350 [Pseudomonadota bacterium]